MLSKELRERRHYRRLMPLRFHVPHVMKDVSSQRTQRSQGWISLKNNTLLNTLAVVVVGGDDVGGGDGGGGDGGWWWWWLDVVVVGGSWWW